MNLFKNMCIFSCICIVGCGSPTRTLGVGDAEVQDINVADDSEIQTAIRRMIAEIQEYGALSRFPEAGSRPAILRIDPLKNELPFGAAFAGEAFEMGLRSELTKRGLGNVLAAYESKAALEETQASAFKGTGGLATPDFVFTGSLYQGRQRDGRDVQVNNMFRLTVINARNGLEVYNDTTTLKQMKRRPGIG